MSAIPRSFTLLGIGTTNPSFAGATFTSTVVITSAATAGLQIYNTADQTTNYERLDIMASGVSGYLIRASRDGTGSTRGVSIRGHFSNTASAYTYANVLYGIPFFKVANSTASTSVGNWNQFGDGTGTSSATSGTVNFLAITPTYNQASGTAANTDLLIQRTETAVGSGTQYLIQAGTAASTTLFTVSNAGRVAAASIGLGGAASSDSNPLIFTASSSAARDVLFRNSGGGTATNMTLRLENASGVGLVTGVNGTAYTSSGLFLQDAGFIVTQSGLSGGLTVGTQAAAPLIFATNDAECGRFLSAGTLQLTAGTTTRAPFNIPHGDAPSSPVDGDMWTTTAGLYVRINGATVGPLAA